MIKAVFFDLGATLWDDYPSELAYWALVVEELQSHGFAVDMERMITESQAVIATFCPSLTRSIVWRITGGCRRTYDAVLGAATPRILQRLADPAELVRLTPLFPGVHDMLEELASRYTLAVVSQNFVEAERWMELHGIDVYFEHTSISARDKLYKPDTRLFLKTCEAVGVEPQQTVMVGDRLDNDIWPANRIGMRSVRVLADPYRIQQPRYHNDVPDHTVEAVAEVASLMLDLAPLPLTAKPSGTASGA